MSSSTNSKVSDRIESLVNKRHARGKVLGDKWRLGLSHSGVEYDVKER